MRTKWGRECGPLGTEPSKGVSFHVRWERDLSCPDKRSASSILSNIPPHVFPGLRLRRLDLSNHLLSALLQLIASWDGRSHSRVGVVPARHPLFSGECDLDNSRERLHVVAFAEAHLEPTVTQHRVDTHIHYNHQGGGLWGLLSQYFSSHWILHDSRDQSSSMSGTYAHRVAWS